MSDYEDLPEELRPHIALASWRQEQVEAYHKNMENKHEAFLSEFAHFLNDLTAEQVAFLKETISKIGDGGIQAELIGIMVGSLMYSKGRTINGVDQDKALEEFISELGLDKDQGEVISDNRLGLDLALPPNTHDPETGESLQQGFENRDYTGEVPNYDRNMVAWNMGNTYTEGGQWAGIVCKGCEMVSLNLEERMKTPPGVDGCKGCQMKAKWG